MGAPGRRGGRRRGQRRPQPRDQQERRHRVAQLHLEQLERVDLAHGLGPGVVGGGVGQQPAGVHGRAGQVRVERGVPGPQRQGGQARGTVLGAGVLERLVVVVRDGLGSQHAGDRGRVGLGDPVEAHHLGQLTVAGQGGVLTRDQRRVGARRAAHGLAGVADQDVERPRRSDVVGQRHDLRGVAQVDADDLEPVGPLLTVVERGEAAHGIVREAGREGEVRPVAQQAQRDVHADLGAPAGEQRASSTQVGALVALGVRARGAARAQPVVERVDEHVVVLADVAAARVDQLAGEGARGRRRQQGALGLVVDAQRGARGRGRGDRPVVGELLRALGELALALDRLEHPRGGALDRHPVRVVLGHRVQRVEHPQRDGQVVGVDHP